MGSTKEEMIKQFRGQCSGWGIGNKMYNYVISMLEKRTEYMSDEQFTTMINRHAQTLKTMKKGLSAR